MALFGDRGGIYGPESVVLSGTGNAANQQIAAADPNGDRIVIDRVHISAAAACTVAIKDASGNKLCEVARPANDSVPQDMHIVGDDGEKVQCDVTTSSTWTVTFEYHYE